MRETSVWHKPFDEPDVAHIHDRPLQPCKVMVTSKVLHSNSDCKIADKCGYTAAVKNEEIR